jgi:2-polyprenyl-6-hydroxyphenyl methylase/3-demethylubiquinone-9 3-methyltransferase
MGTSASFLESSKYTKPGLRGAHQYLLPSLLRHASDLAPHSRILDVGCGNGAVATEFAKRGRSVVGIDLAEAGVRIARESCPAGRFEVLAADKNVLENLGEEPFDLVYSSEVIEHLYDPRSFVSGCFVAVKSQGKFICTTPYHGYWKNLALSLADGWDKHADPLFDGGHIKLFSRKTLTALLTEAGFQHIQFSGSGRLPYLWKSMVMEVRKP